MKTNLGTIARSACLITATVTISKSQDRLPDEEEFYLDHNSHIDDNKRVFSIHPSAALALQEERKLAGRRSDQLVERAGTTLPSRLRHRI